MFKGVGDNSTPFLIYLLMSVTINQVISLLAERSGKTFDIPFQEELKIIADYWISTILKQAKTLLLKQGAQTPTSRRVH